MIPRDPVATLADGRRDTREKQQQPGEGQATHCTPLQRSGEAEGRWAREGNWSES